MNLDSIHNTIRFRLQKEISGFVKPEDIDLSLDQAQMDYLDYLIGETRKYQPGRPISPVHMMASQRVNDELIPVKERVSFIEQSQILIPGDFLYFMAIYTDVVHGTQGVKARRVQILREDELADALSSQVAAASEEEPVAIMDNSIRLYPSTIQHSGYYWYIRRPNIPEYSYTTNPDRSVTYNPSSSVQMDWYDSSIYNIIDKAVAILSNTLKDQSYQEFSLMKDKTGE